MVSTRTGFLNRLFSALRTAPEPGTSQALTPLRGQEIAAPVNEPLWVPTELAPPVSRRGFLDLAGRGTAAILRARNAPSTGMMDALATPESGGLIQREVGGYLRGLNDFLSMVDQEEGLVSDEAYEAARRLIRPTNRVDPELRSTVGQSPWGQFTTVSEPQDLFSDVELGGRELSNNFITDLSRRWQLNDPQALRQVVERNIGAPLEDVWSPLQYHPANAWGGNAYDDAMTGTYGGQAIPLRQRMREMFPEPVRDLYRRYAPSAVEDTQRTYQQHLNDLRDAGDGGDEYYR